MALPANTFSEIAASMKPSGAISMPASTSSPGLAPHSHQCYTSGLFGIFRKALLFSNV